MIGLDETPLDLVSKQMFDGGSPFESSQGGGRVVGRTTVLFCFPARQTSLTEKTEPFT